MRIDIQDDLIAGRKAAREFSRLGMELGYVENAVRKFVVAWRKPYLVLSCGRLQIFRQGVRRFHFIVPGLFFCTASFFGHNFDLEVLELGMEFGSNEYMLHSGGMLRLTREAVEIFGFLPAFWQVLEEGL